MWKWIIALLLGLPALYLLYTLYIVLRLRIEVGRLIQPCAARGYGLEWQFYTMFPGDIEDPIILNVMIKRDKRCFSFTLFGTLLSNFRYTRVKIEPLVLFQYLQGRIAIEPKAGSAIDHIYIPEGRVKIHHFGIESMDQRYQLREDTNYPVSPEGLSVLCEAFGDAELKARLDAYGDSIAFEYGPSMSLSPAREDQSFLDGIERAGQLADALDAAVKGGGPYR